MRHLLTSSLLCLSALAGFGCIPTIPVDPGEPLELRETLGVDDADVVGVTIDPETNQVFLLDATHGLFELHADDTATRLLSMEEFPEPDVPARSSFTDIAAMGNGVFAITALGDGYLLDLRSHTMLQHFCYEPGFMDQEFSQLTNSLAYDAERDMLFAQPVTMESGAGIGSHFGAAFATYDVEGGQPTGWYDAPAPDFLAGAVCLDADGSFLAIEDNELFRFEVDSWREVERLGRLPLVNEVVGMAMDVEAGQLMVVDGRTDRLYAINMNRGPQG